MGAISRRPNSISGLFLAKEQPGDEGGGVAGDCKVHPWRREELIVKHRTDCWDGPVRRVLGPDICSPPLSSSAFLPPPQRPAWVESALPFPGFRSFLLTAASKQTEDPPQKSRPLGFWNTAGKVLIWSVYKIRPRFSLRPQHLGSGSF